jgi:hypothetical protein
LEIIDYDNQRPVNIQVLQLQVYGSE